MVQADWSLVWQRRDSGKYRYNINCLEQIRDHTVPQRLGCRLGRQHQERELQIPRFHQERRLTRCRRYNQLLTRTPIVFIPHPCFNVFWLAIWFLQDTPCTNAMLAFHLCRAGPVRPSSDQVARIVREPLTASILAGGYHILVELGAGDALHGVKRPSSATYFARYACKEYVCNQLLSCLPTQRVSSSVTAEHSRLNKYTTVVIDPFAASRRKPRTRSHDGSRFERASIAPHAASWRCPTGHAWRRCLVSFLTSALRYLSNCQRDMNKRSLPRQAERVLVKCLCSVTVYSVLLV